MPRPTNMTWTASFGMPFGSASAVEIQKIIKNYRREDESAAKLVGVGLTEHDAWQLIVNSEGK